MMETNKYILCGGEDLCNTYKGCGISEKGEGLFNKWAIGSLANPCLHEKEAFLDMPVSSDRRLLIRAILEQRKGSRTLVWYVGVEFSKEDINEASCYANFIRGLLAIPLETVKNLRNSEFLSVNLQYPSGLPQIQTPFEELKGKNLYGEYPRILWEFCQKISLNDIADWFERLFLAVNVEVQCPEYTNMVCEIQPQLIARPTPPPSPKETKAPSSSTTHTSEALTEIKGGLGKMLKLFFPLWIIFTIGIAVWGADQSMKLSDKAAILEKKDRVHQGEIKELKSKYNATIAQKDQAIRGLNARIKTLSTPKDIAKTLSDLDAQIRDIEERLNSLDKVGQRLNELKQRLRELKKECGHAAEPTPETKKIL